LVTAGAASTEIRSSRTSAPPGCSNSQTPSPSRTGAISTKHLVEGADLDALAGDVGAEHVDVPVSPAASFAAAIPRSSSST